MELVPTRNYLIEAQGLLGVAALSTAIDGTKSALDTLIEVRNNAFAKGENVLLPEDGKIFLITSYSLVGRAERGIYCEPGCFGGYAMIANPETVDFPDSDIFRSQRLEVIDDGIYAIGLDGVTCQKYNFSDKLTSEPNEQ